MYKVYSGALLVISSLLFFLSGFVAHIREGKCIPMSVALSILGVFALIGSIELFHKSSD